MRIVCVWLLLFVLGMAAVPAAPAPLVVGLVPKGAALIQLIGTRQGGAWTDGDKVKSLPGGRWQTFTLTGVGPTLTSSKLQGDQTGSLVFPLSNKAPIDGLAICGGQARQTRHGRTVKPDLIIVAQLRQLLIARGAQVKRVRVTQCVQIDLLGDGDPEWLICAQSRDDIATAGDTRKPSDYSLAALAWITPRGPRRASELHVEPLVIETLHPRDGLAQDYRFVGAADIDGSGRMVFGLESTYYEGGGMTLYGFDGVHVRKLVAGGWGL